jgi:hypothetical protein
LPDLTSSGYVTAIIQRLSTTDFTAEQGRWGTLASAGHSVKRFSVQDRPSTAHLGLTHATTWILADCGVNLRVAHARPRFLAQIWHRPGKSGSMVHPGLMFPCDGKMAGSCLGYYTDRIKSRCGSACGPVVDIEVSRVATEHSRWRFLPSGTRYGSLLSSIFMSLTCVVFGWTVRFPWIAPLRLRPGCYRASHCLAVVQCEVPAERC